MAQIGMRHVVAAPIATEVAGSPVTYGAGFVVGRAVSANYTRNYSTDNDLYGEDDIAETDDQLVDYSLDVGTTELVEEAESKLLGLTHDTTNDTYEETGAPAPYHGLGYIRVFKRNGQLRYKAIWCYKIRFSRNSEEDNTKGKQISWGTPTINGHGMGVYPDASGTPHFRKTKLCETLAAAATWLDGLANIGTTSGNGN